MSLVVGIVVGAVLAAFGTWGAVLILLVTHPEKVRLWASWFYAGARLVFKRAEYAYIANDVSGHLGQHFAKELGSNIDGVRVPQVVIKWDNSPEAVARERAGTLIVRMRPHEDRILNILNASLAATPRLIAANLRPQLTPAESQGIDLQLCRRLAESLGRSASTTYVLEILQPLLNSIPGLPQMLDRFDTIDLKGLFKPVFLQELVKLSSKVGAGRPLRDVAREVRAFAAFLVRIARRRPRQLTTLSFVGTHIRVNIMLVARLETRAVGVKAYYGRAGLELGRGVETIYLLSMGSNISFAEDVARALDADRRLMKQRSKKITIDRDGERVKVLITPFELNPGYSATQHFRDAVRAAGIQRGSRANVVVTDVEDEYVLADLNGIQVSIPCGEVSWGDVADCRTVIALGEDLEVEVVNIDEMRREVVASRRLRLPNPLAPFRDDQLLGIRGALVIEARRGANGAYVAGHLRDRPELPVRLPRVELDWGTDDPALPEVGDEVPVVIHAVDRAAGTLTGSRKRLAGDRWDVIRARYPGGTRLTVNALVVSDIGVTCEVEPGLSGFIPAAEFQRAGYEYADFTTNLRPGQELYAYVRRVVAGERQRVTLGLQQNLPRPP